MYQKMLKSLMIAFALMLTVSTTAFADSMASDQSKADTMASSSQTESMAPTQNSNDGTDISITFENSPVKAGDNNFKIIAEDANKKPVTGAQVKVTFDMDRSKMDTMGMKDPIVVTLKEDKLGEYSGTVKLENAGQWMAKAELNASGKNSNKDFNFTVESAGPNMIVIGGFVGVVAIIIIAALIAKKKKSTVKA